MILQPSGDIEQQWQRVRALLHDEIGATAYGTWLKPLRLAECDGDRVVISVPTQFMRDWVVSNYADRIRGIWNQVNPAIRSIALNVKAQDGGAARGQRVVEPSGEPRDPARSDGVTPLVRRDDPPVATSRRDPVAPETVRPLDELSASLDPRFTFEAFVVGKPNEFAVAAAERIAESTTLPFNPLFLYGGVGLGKTHLMHAIGWRAKQLDPQRRVIYLSAEKFMYQFVRALRTKGTMEFKELFRSVDLLMVDDVQFISGKDSTQEEFFHTFNALVDRGRSIVISADRSPSDLAGLEERIRSRLGQGLVADIHPTTFELRLGILDAKAEQLGAEVRRDVIEFLADRITSNVRELEGALNRIVHQASLTSRPVTIEMAQEVLRDLLRSHERRVTIEEIQRMVVEHYAIRMSDMSSSRRARAVARPRQVAMYLAKQLTPRSLPEIGKKFGGRDHTTVMHAIRQIEKLSAEDRVLADDLAQLKRRLQN
ncbi:MAG: chromosomal replication initiator protein DnaA [Geminicoccaceae bacterium]|nr:chromosomal replication initiator protein DnaA [Geminicoccaceae bacterium]